ncbi:MAG: PHP domain-containing protein [Kiritimatiellae bacterium]|nr:PHP domain-containing protein [Kiritimatiellia bacterium]
MLVDFHVHSNASDGTEAPSKIVGMADGFTALAITDHDNCDGLAECASARPDGVRFVTGVELSIEPGEGFDKFHLLALGFDPSNAEVKSLLRRVLDGRNIRNERILENFARIGIEIDPAQINTYANGEVLARPHFARYLIDYGYASSIKDAFDRFLLPDSPIETRCYSDRIRPSQEETFRVIHEAGGLCVMAHPKFWKREWKTSGVDLAAAEKELFRLKEAGLDGLEALYQANTPGENVDFIRIAEKVGLLKTAGSDFHGASKPDISFGMEVSESFIAPFLERCPFVA